MVIPLILAIVIPLIIAAWYNYRREYLVRYKALVRQLRRAAMRMEKIVPPYYVREGLTPTEFKRFYQNDWSPLFRALSKLGTEAQNASERLQAYLAYFGPPRV